MNPSKLCLLCHLIALCALALLPSTQSFAAPVCNPTAPIPPGWGSPQKLRNGLGGTYISARGDIFVVWINRLRDLSFSVKVTHRPPGLCSTSVTTQQVNSVSDPKLAVNDQGHAMLAVQNYNFRWQVREYSPTAGWSAWVEITPPFAERNWNFQLGIDNAGNAVAAWQTDEGPYGSAIPVNVLVRRYTPTAGWGATTNLGTVGTWHPHSFRLGVPTQHGAPLLLWEVTPSPPHRPRSDYYVSRLTPRGWSTMYVGGNRNILDTADMVINRKGNALVTGFIPPVVRFYDTSTGWATPTMFHGGSIWRAALSDTSKPAAIFVGEHFESIGGWIPFSVSRYADGKWTTTLLSTPAQATPKAVAMDDQTNAMVLAVGDLGSYVSYYNANCSSGVLPCGWSAPTHVTHSHGGLHMWPNGNAMVSYHKQLSDGSYELWMRRFYR